MLVSFKAMLNEAIFPATCNAIKCFVSHRPTDPFFSEKKKKKKNSRFASQEQILQFTSTRSCFINNRDNWYDVMSFSLINIDTMFFKGCFDSRVNLRIFSCLACVYRVMDAREKFGEHERCVRFARGDSLVQL